VTARIALALFVIIPAAMAYPWRTVPERWVLGVAIAVVVVVFAWWGGLFVTTALGRRWNMLRRNRGGARSIPDNEVLVLLSVEAPKDAALPLPLLAGYVDRFGVRCAKVRVTNLDVGGERRTWIGLTVAADDNLAALAARASDLPLYDTAEVVGRRLADHLRELGFVARFVDAATDPVEPGARETWRGVRDGAGTVAVYTVPVDGSLPEHFDRVWAHTQLPTWSALEFVRAGAHTGVVALCAVRSDAGSSGSPLPEWKPQNGIHGDLVDALHPCSVRRFDVRATDVPDGLLDALRWPAASSAAPVGAHSRG
jgi:type VII secretion protein EccE